MPAELATAPDVRERPIIFSGPMVRAILAGNKTQTRRPVKPQPPPADEVFVWQEPGIPPAVKAEEGLYYRDAAGLKFLRTCPYGAPGDRLWVRETWSDLVPDHYTEPGRPRDMLSDRYDTPRRNGAAYLADSLNKIGEEDGDSKRCRVELGYRWRSPMFMPRWASRLVVEVTEVQVERLHDLDAIDVRREGVEGSTSTFMEKWDDMYAGGPFAVRRNPWVWVVSFRRVA